MFIFIKVGKFVSNRQHVDIIVLFFFQNVFMFMSET